MSRNPKLPQSPVVFLDANVLMSASWSNHSFTAELLKTASSMQFMTCTYAVDEARRNLQVKRPPSLPIFEDLLTRVRIVATIIDDQPSGVDLNVKDTPIYVSAKAAKADILLTGDKDFQTLAATHPMPRIMTPRQLFVWILEGEIE